nr:hypothetical protein [Cyclobacteriaceae bacterium]
LLFLIVVSFFVLIYHHQKKKREVEKYSFLQKINEAEISFKQNEFRALFTNTNITLANHPYQQDLDIVGKHSLFQYLNRAGTLSGANRVAELLLFGLPDIANVKEQQAFYAAWQNDVEARQAFQCEALLSGEKQGDREAIIRWLQQPELFKQSFIFKMVRILFPVLTIVSIVATSFGYFTIGLPLLLILINWTITGFYFKQISLFHQEISEKGKLLFRYASLLNIINNKNFEDEKGSKIKTRCSEANKNLHQLSVLLEWFDARLNMAASFFLNTLFLYDIQLVFKIENWKRKHAQDLPIWLNDVTETEAAISFAGFADNHPEFVLPEATNLLTFQVQKVGHPLLANQHCVTNTILFINDKNLALVTGANMAGKSTFLRAIGVNFVLAKAGAKVFAKNFIFPWISLRTGMRTSDSLHDHQSYFYAELHRLKDIIDTLKQGVTQLILLDEILKGTNSNDKLLGSHELIKQLIKLPTICLIATHDVALGEMEKEFPDKINNVHFEPNIIGDELHFDYRLKQGIAEKMNATFLMKKMGIIPSAS